MNLPVVKTNRWYQTETVERLFDIIQSDSDAHPLAGLPTASGKSHTMCLLIDRLLTEDPRKNVLMLCDITEVIKQNHADLEEYFETEIGLYCGKLDSKTFAKITCASIQSAKNNPDDFEDFDFVIIDEVHAIPARDESMYRTFLKKIKATYIGFSATLFNMAGGYLHEGENALFNCVAIDLTTGENYLRLVKEGFLCPIYSQSPKNRFDIKGLKTERGDYSSKDQSLRFNREDLTRKCLEEVCTVTENFYKRGLLFAIDVNHANSIHKMLNEEFQISSCVVHSKMEADYETTIRDMKKGKYKISVSVDMLTTGYNDPKLDFGVAMFTTKSVNKHVQTMGRLGRTDETKDHSLWFDFGTNIDRLGEINNPLILRKGEKGTGEPIMKVCPECRFHCHGSLRICWNCEHEFVFQTKLTTGASKAKVIKDEFEKQDRKEINETTNAYQSGWVKVNSVNYELRISKATAETFIVVSYKTIFGSVEDKLFFGSEKARHFANHWIQYRWDSEHRKPSTPKEVLANKAFLVSPVRIKTDKRGKYPVVVDYEF